MYIVDIDVNNINECEMGRCVCMYVFISPGIAVGLVRGK